MPERQDIWYMDKYVMSAEEKAYLKAYDLSKYDRPSVTADIAVFAVREEQNGKDGEAGQDENYRKDPVRELKILLVKRGSYPYKDFWALPGGFSMKHESSHETALRELQEETGVRDAYLRPFGVFSKPGRDPRGWIISHGYLALIDGNGYRLHAGTDAWEAAWFTTEIKSSELTRKTEDGETKVENRHELKLYQAQRELTLSAKVREKKIFSGLHGTAEYEIEESGGLAFDHAQIILNAWQNLQREAEKEGRIVFDLMPESFTLNQLQRAFEMVLGRELLTANFRRKIAPMVIETQEETCGAGHRPAKLYRRNLEEFFL